MNSFRRLMGSYVREQARTADNNGQPISTGVGTLAEHACIAAILVAAAVASIAWQGFQFPTTNNSYHIPIMLRYFGSAEGPHDAATESLKNFVSYFWICMSWIATESNLPAVFFTAHVIIRVSIFALLYLLLSALGSKGIGAAVIVGVAGFAGVLPSASILARNEILAPGLTHSAAVIPFVLASWVFLLRRRWAGSAIVIGLAFNANIFVAVWSGVVHASVLIHRHWRESWATLAWLCVGSVLLFLLSAMPTLVWLIQAVDPAAPPVTFSYNQFMGEYFPSHNFVTASLSRATTEFAFIACGLVLVMELYRRTLDRAHGTLMVISICLVVIVAGIGSVLPYVIDHQLALNLLPLRMDAYLYFSIAVFVLAAALRTKLNPGGEDGAYGGLLLLAGMIGGNVAVLAASIQNFVDSGRRRAWLPKIVLTSVLLATAAVTAISGDAPVLASDAYPRLRCLVVVSMVAFAIGPRPRALGDLLLYTAAVMIAVPLPESSALTVRLVSTVPLLMLALRIVWPACGVPAGVVAWIAVTAAAVAVGPMAKSVQTIALAAVAVGAGLAIAWLLGRRGQALNLRPALMGVVMAIYVGLGALGLVLHGGWYVQTPKLRAWIAAQAWARANTAPDTLFLAFTDVRLPSFATFSRRPSWFDEKLGAVVLWQPTFYETWKYRRDEMRLLKHWNDVIDLAGREKIGFVVLARDVAASMMAPVGDAVHADEIFLVFRMPAY